MNVYARFKQFISALQNGFKRIANRSQGELTVEDLQSEAWILVTEWGEKNDVQPDLTDQKFHSTILKHLHNRYIKGYGNKSVRYAKSIDKTYKNAEGESQENYIFAQLKTITTDEPDAIFIRLQEENEQDAKMAASFSELVAYTKIFKQLDTCSAVAEHLGVSICTIRQKIFHAKKVFRRQASLFDGIAIIPPDFMPPRGLSKYCKCRSSVKIHSLENFSIDLLYFHSE